MTITFDAFSTTTNGDRVADPNFSHSGGTPRGVLVLVAGANYATDPVVGIDYGTLALTKETAVFKTTGETGFVGVWSGGASIPTGTQTVDVDAGGNTINAYCYTIAADADTEINNTANVVNDSLQDPSVNLALSGKESFVAMVWHAGQASLGGITPNTGWTSRSEDDWGAEVIGSYSYDTIGTADVSVGYDTASADDVLLIGAALSEVVGGGATGIEIIGQYYTRLLGG